MLLWNGTAAVYTVWIVGTAVAVALFILLLSIEPCAQDEAIGLASLYLQRRSQTNVLRVHVYHHRHGEHTGTQKMQP